jgi:hypothetical protein
MTTTIPNHWNHFSLRFRKIVDRIPALLENKIYYSKDDTKNKKQQMKKKRRRYWVPVKMMTAPLSIWKEDA